MHPTEKESARVQQQRYDFWQAVRGILAKNMIFIDESGINLALTRLFARSSKGERARDSKPIKRGKNVSVIVAIGIDGLLTQMSILGAEDSLTFEAFIATKLAPKLWIGAYVFMDNCSIHKGENIEALIAVSGVTLIYLPPYSPDFHQLRIVGQRLRVFCVLLARETILIYSNLLKMLLIVFLLQIFNLGLLILATVPH